MVGGLLNTRKKPRRAGIHPRSSERVGLACFHSGEACMAQLVSLYRCRRERSGVSAEEHEPKAPPTWGEDACRKNRLEQKNTDLTHPL